MPTAHHPNDILNRNESIKLSHIRKICLLKIEQKVFDWHSAARVLKERPDEYYSKLDRVSSLEALREYNVLLDDDASTTNISLLVVKLDQTIEFVEWTHEKERSVNPDKAIKNSYFSGKTVQKVKLKEFLEFRKIKEVKKDKEEDNTKGNGEKKSGPVSDTTR